MIKTYLLIVAAVFAVLALTAGGRTLLTWLATAFKPFLGIVVYLVSAHYTIFRHLTTSRSIIYPSLVKKTVHRN